MLMNKNLKYTYNFIISLCFFGVSNILATNQQTDNKKFFQLIGSLRDCKTINISTENEITTLINSSNRILLNTKSNKGKTPLTLLASLGLTKSMEALINKGADINELDKNYNSAIQYAIQSRRLGAVKLLLSNDANTFQKNTKGFSPLLRAGKLATLDPENITAADKVFVYIVNHLAQKQATQGSSLFLFEKMMYILIGIMLMAVCTGACSYILGNNLKGQSIDENSF